VLGSAARAKIVATIPTPLTWMSRIQIVQTIHIHDPDEVDVVDSGSKFEIYVRVTSGEHLRATSRKRWGHGAGLVSSTTTAATQLADAFADLGSTNGLRVNGERRRSIQLAPGDEVELGGFTLMAESCRSIELHELLQRWIGWSTSRLGEADRVLRDVRAMANLQAALILRGVDGLVGVARRLHRITLGDLPFVTCGRSESGEQRLARAVDGMLYVDTRDHGGGLGTVLADLRASGRRVRLVARADSARSMAELAAMLPRIATISIPPLTEREDELERLLEAYGSDAVAELGASWPGFRSSDPERVLAGGIATLDEIEDAARRLVALRNWGVTDGAKRLKLSPGALSRWARRRKIPT